MTDDTATLRQRAAMAWHSGDLDGTETALRALLAAEPDDMGHRAGLYEVGVGYAVHGRPAEAARVLEECVDHPDTELPARTALGVVLVSLGREVEAEDHLRAVLDRQPKNVAALSNLGALKLGQGLADEAHDLLARAKALDPLNARTLNNLGLAANASGRLEDARRALEKAVKIAPDFTDARLNLGKTLRESGRIGEALATYREALGRAPTDAGLISNYLYALNFDDTAAPAEVIAEHVKWAANIEAPGDIERPDRPAGDRLRIGYVSPDFRTHSVGYFIEGVLEHHDRAAVEVHCFSDTREADATTDRMRGLAEKWHDCRGLTDRQMAEEIAEAGIDVLIDLAGHTAGGRMAVFAAKPAPVQVGWIGYPNVTGLPAMDARLVDATADPDETGIGEALVRLDGGFLCYRPPADAPAPGRSGDRPPTFGSFNACAKLDDRTLGLWARLLDTRPDARLLLKSWPFADPDVAGAFRHRFAAVGGDPERLDLWARIPEIGDHLGAYGMIDVALDPLVYNGTTTTCEALWMGVPVVSMRGDRHAARVGASLLGRIGRSDWVAEDEDAYLATARALLDAPPAREAVRATVAASPLVDGAAFAAGLEATLARLAKEAHR